MRRTLGTAVFGGMLGVTLFGIFLTPVFFYVIEGINDLMRRVRRWWNPEDSDSSEPPEPPAAQQSDKPLIQRPVHHAHVTVVETATG